MTKLADHYCGTFTARLPTEPPPAPERPAGASEDVARAARLKAVRRPWKRVLTPRVPQADDVDR